MKKILIPLLPMLLSAQVALAQRGGNGAVSRGVEDFGDWVVGVVVSAGILIVIYVGGQVAGGRGVATVLLLIVGFLIAANPGDLLSMLPVGGR